MKKASKIFILTIAILIMIPIFSFAFDVPDAGPSKCVGNCGSGSGGGYSPPPSYNYEAERQRQEAERQRQEAERQRQLEVERQRQQEAERQRIIDEKNAKHRQAEFEKSKAKTLKQMKGFPDNELNSTNSGRELKLKGLEENNAAKEAQSNLYRTKEGNSGAVFDTKGTKVPVSLGSIQMSERVKKDPRMVKEQKELANLQAERQKLDNLRTNLAKERNSTKDPEKMKELTKELDKIEKVYQSNILAVSNQVQKVEKLKRTIDAEVEGAAKNNPKGIGK